MADLNLSFVDIAVLAIVLISAAYATWRGFVSETLSIFAWAAAAFAALYLGPLATHVLHGHISPDWLSTIAAYAGVFLIVVIPLAFISHGISQAVKHSPVHTLDRALGFGFGVVRGLAIIGIAYIVFTMFVPVKEQPGYLAQASTLPLIQGSSEVLLSLVPPETKVALAVDNGGAQEDTASSGEAERNALKRHRLEKTYGASQRRALDNLIEATGSGRNQKP